MNSLCKLLTFCLAIYACNAAGDWTYTDQEAWAEVDAPKNEACNGIRQSPIDIVTSDTEVSEELENDPFKFSEAFSHNILDATYKNTGYTLQMDDEARDHENGNVLEGGYLPTDGVEKFTFLQFHYHWGNASGFGSEHTVDGYRYPAEIHFVFIAKDKGANDTDALTVLGFFLEIAEDDNYMHEGTWNKLFTAITGANGASPITDPGVNDTTSFDNNWSISDLIPIYYYQPTRKLFRYAGSLTTPPCYETVTWNVFADPIYISQNQYDQFLTATNKYGDQMANNYRHVQPLNGRKVYRTSITSVSKPSSTPDWSYDNQKAWGDNAPACNGQSQSPINIETDKTVHDGVLDTGFTFKKALGIPLVHLELTNKGYTYQMTNKDYEHSELQIVNAPGAPPATDDFTFWQFHYHWGTADKPGSEHTINGKRFMAEVHFVFKSLSTPIENPKSLLVLGFMIEVNNDPGFHHGGEFGNVLDAITELMNKDDKEHFDDAIAIADLIPIYDPVFMSKFYHYDGSLTTPPCLEVVNWFVLETPLYVSNEQYLQFTTGFDFRGDHMQNTYRELQPLNDRVVYRTKAADGSAEVARLSVLSVFAIAFARLVAY